ncbi:MAG: glycosyltransferase [Sulfurospirillaceae bacterium]|nr:glycosyltransferase [Sulfurospirillaceae bacterium]
MLVEKNIAIFIENYVAGGSDKIARDLIDGLSYKKAYVFVNKSNDTSILLATILPSNVELIRYGVPTLAELGMMANSFKSSRKLLFICFKAWNLLIRYPLILWFVVYFFFLFRKYPIDVFFSNNGGYPGGECNRATTLAAYLIGSKNYHIVHNIATKVFLKIATPFEYMIDTMIDKCSKIICVSHQTKEELLQKRFIKQEPLVIYNGVKAMKTQIKDFILGKEKLKLLNIGALGERKNQLLIIEALHILQKKGYNQVALYIVGKEEDAGYLEMLKHKITQYGLQNIYFEGFSKDPYQYYDSCDVFILSSIVESFALVRVEAMSVGMPVITTDVGDAHIQVQNGVNGFIIDGAESMASAIEKYMLDATLVAEHAKNGYEIYRCNFTDDKMLKQYQALIDKD